MAGLGGRGVHILRRDVAALLHHQHAVAFFGHAQRADRAAKAAANDDDVPIWGLRGCCVGHGVNQCCKPSKVRASAGLAMLRPARWAQAASAVISSPLPLARSPPGR